MERKPKILALDDDRNWLHQVPLILGSQYEIVTKASIDSGITEIEESLFDVILLDINFENDPRWVLMYSVLSSKRQWCRCNCD